PFEAPRYPRPYRFDDRRIFDSSNQRVHGGAVVDKLSPGDRDPTRRRALEQAPLVRHQVKRLERRNRDRTASERGTILRHRVRCDVRYREEDVYPRALDEIHQEPEERLRMPIGRRIRDVVEAVPGRGREADWLFIAHENGDTM